MVIPKSGGRRGWATDPDAYPVLTVEDRRRLAFGTEDKKHRTRADQDAAWEELPGVEIVSRTATTQDGQSGWVTLGGGDEPLGEGLNNPHLGRNAIGCGSKIRFEDLSER